MSKLMAGAGRGTITPKVGSMLMGYAPARVAEEIGDNLQVTALALKYGDTSAMLISADICILDDRLCMEIRSLIGKATGVAAQNIILATTHTHSGPTTRGLPGGADLDEAYVTEVLKPETVRAARMAADNLTPALVGIGAVDSDVGINRREIDRAGNVILGQNPWGCHDPVMTVVSFRRTDSTPIANIIHYGAHCTAAGKNPEVTRDWAGPMTDRMTEETGAVTMFINGALGDCGPRLSNGKTTGDLKLARELGGRAAIDAVRAYRTIREYRELKLAVLSGIVSLPYEPAESVESIKEKIAQMGDLKSLIGMKLMEYDALARRLEQARDELPYQTHMPLEQTILSVGPVAIVPFPFEIFSEITLRIRKFSPFQHTLCLSNTNGSSLYFPSRDQICRGGYEVWVFKSMNVQPLADDADDAAVEGSLRLLDALHALL